MPRSFSLIIAVAATSEPFKTIKAPSTPLATYPSGDVDGEIARCVESRHGSAPTRGEHDPASRDGALLGVPSDFALAPTGNPPREEDL